MKGSGMMLKKVLTIAILALGISLVLAGTAGAAGNPHSGFASNTDACAACHRAHTALSANLLMDAQGVGMCRSCHENGTGADTDVMNGRYVDSAAAGHEDWGTVGAKLLAGVYKTVDEVGGTATSSHIIGWLGTPPGADTTDQILMECTSCHSPHPEPNAGGRTLVADVTLIGTVTPQLGSTLKTGSTLKARTTATSSTDTTNIGGAWAGSGPYVLCGQYRLLRTKPNGWTGAAIQVPWNGPWDDSDQDSTSATAAYAGYTEKDFYPNETTDPGVQYYTNNYKDNIDEWCIACHSRYKIRGDANGQTGDNYDAGDGEGAVPRYRHATDLPIQGQIDPFNELSYQLITDLPLEDATGNGRTYADDKLTCLTCHLSHGTDVEMTGYADFASFPVLPGSDPDRGERGTLPTNSMLLRLPNRGVCVACHSMGTF